MKEFLSRFRLPIFVGAGIAALILAWFLYAFYGANRWDGPPGKTFFVSRGQTFSSIVDSLEGKGILRSKALFVFVAKIVGGISHLQVGKYVFQNGISNLALYQEMRTGRGAAIIQVSIPEGVQARQQARLFARALGADSARFVGLVHDEGFTHSLGIESASLEGYLLPDTYSFPWQQDEKEIIRREVEQFQRFYTDSLRERAAAIGWSTNQVLALASIVEGESRVSAERPVIAGVYYNRLRKGMRLEADPTIQYILEDGPRRVLYDDLRIDNPYNTYLYPGLPPGPVNNPGRASILAALHPSDHRFLYFVANGTGGHWFSRTFEEHERYVRMYRRVRARQRATLLHSSGSHGSSQL